MEHTERYQHIFSGLKFNHKHRIYSHHDKFISTPIEKDSSNLINTKISVLASTLPSHFLRRFFVSGCQFGFVREIISQEFRQIYHFRNSDERILRGQMSLRNNPAPSDGRQTPLVLSKMARSETMYCSSTLCAIHGERRPI